jgi:hypothetical protein
LRGGNFHQVFQSVHDNRRHTVATRLEAFSFLVLFIREYASQEVR